MRERVTPEEVIEKTREALPFWVQGKAPRVLKASAEYTASVVNGMRINQLELAKKHNCSMMSIRNNYPVMLSLYGVTRGIRGPVSPCTKCGEMTDEDYYRISRVNKSEGVKVVGRLCDHCYNEVTGGRI